MNQNNVAASGWGAPIPETTHSRSESQQTSEDGSEYSDEFYDSEEEDEEEYAPLQMGSWGTQPSGDQADVNAIQMPDWNQRPKDETPSLTFTSADWGKLCDPKVVIKSGIGSGNLHRKGANYKPVDEQHILNQRLKLGSPLPGSGKKKKRGGAKTGKKPKPPGIPPSRPPSSAPRPPSSTASRRPPLAQSAWGNSQLASTPFWESGGAKSSKYASTPTPPPPAAPATPAAPVAPVAPAPQQRLPGGRPAPTGWAASKWANQTLQTNPVAPSPQQPMQTPTATPPKPAGAAASKYAPKPVAQPAPVAPTPPAAASSPTTAVHGTISLNEPIKPIRKTIFQLNIELIPGVSAILPVYETDDYITLVKEFGAKHHLTISQQAEASFAEKIKMMVATLRNQQAEQ